MTVGYAAFSTNITITAKGNIKSRITIDDLKKQVIEVNDGLYKDTYEGNRYIYRGKAPNNYITFNNELWRIISIESDNTLKIIKQDSIGDMLFDEINNRDSATSTFCDYASTYGCNVWASASNLKGNPNEIIAYYPNGGANNATSSISGTVIKDSSLNTYLNTTYYNSLSDNSKIVSGNFFVGSPGTEYDQESIELNLEQAKKYIWNGKIGLMDLVEYMRSSTNSACISIKAGYEDSTACGDNNWLNTKIKEWTISLYPKSQSVWNIDENGRLGDTIQYFPARTRGVRPVLYLKSDITLTGNGTKDNPYIIK